ncbi:hypothetical protein [Micrococcus sp.]|uniref:hypothetical protein n=1 Tax=Micrococcus sp. TaxID=1271 RepID=UPI002A909C20|nr:hypothetical protein [Micrococcus sp.]MDY6056130.1 hypothetical protein [Micrococcus sp.]
MSGPAHEQPAPPPRRWEHPLDTHSHTGPYRPPRALLDILARVAGADSHATAAAATRDRVAAAVVQLHEAGLDPRVIGLVAEPRVNELLGVAESTGRSLRGRDGLFPVPAARGRLWCEADVAEYVEYRHETAPRPGALRSARMAGVRVDLGTAGDEGLEA